MGKNITIITLSILLCWSVFLLEKQREKLVLRRIPQNIEIVNNYNIHSSEVQQKTDADELNGFMTAKKQEDAQTLQMLHGIEKLLIKE